MASSVNTQWRRAAQIALGVCGAAFARTVEEYIRLSRGRANTNLRPYAVGAAIEALTILLCIPLFVKAKHRAVVAVTAGMVVLLLVYKVAILGW